MATTQATGSSPSDTAPLIDWNLTTVPQPSSANRVMRCARGKCLGGSSARHYLVYHRANKGCYDAWAAMTSDEAWGFDKLKKYFARSVSLTPADAHVRRASSVLGAEGSVPFEGLGGEDSGPLDVTWGKWMQAGATVFQDAAARAGIPPNAKNFLSGELMGTAWTPGTVQPREMTRASSKTAFLDEAIWKETDNLKIYTRAEVKQILFDGRRATGVKVQTEGYPFIVRARKEVLLCAGSFHSPQLLMVSGVGPSQTLKRYGISIVTENEHVGMHLQDHAAFAVSYRLKAQTNSRLGYDAAYAKEAMREYVSERQGPLTGMPACLGFEKLPSPMRSEFTERTGKELAALPQDWPEVEYIIGEGHKGWGTNFKAEAPKDSYNYVSVTAVLVAPTSRGTVGISSADMKDAPVIDPKLLSIETDKQMALAAFTRLRQIGDEMQASGFTVGGEYFPGRGTQASQETEEPNNGRDAIREGDKSGTEEYIRASHHTTYHAACTNRMAISEKDGVLDSQCRVFGTESLRVVDASSFPVLPPGHPQATVYALTERVAEWIVDQYR